MSASGRLTPQECNFFTRNAGYPEFAAEIAPDLKPADGDMLRIADIGCSSGESMLCLGAAMLVAGVEDFRLTGYDLNNAPLGYARLGAYQIRRARFLHNLAESPYPDACARHFVFDETGTIVEAGPTLKSKVTPYQNLDILTTPLLGEHDAASIHNVFGHYQDSPKLIDGMLGNLVTGLVPGATLLYDDFRFGIPDKMLRKHDLVPHPDARLSMASHIFMYKEPQA